MIVLLPPSETKHPSGTHPPLVLAELSFPELNPVRQRLIIALTSMSFEDARIALRLSERQNEEIKHNTVLREAATLPAIDRYTGVLYDALAASTLPPAARNRLFVASALFGLVAAENLIPPYRLSGGSRLPSVGGLPAVWKPALRPVLDAFTAELIVDLRSAAYAALAPLPGAITVRVVTAEGKTVSHFNKATKGLLARALSLTPAETVADIVDVARAGGLAARKTGERIVEITHV